MTTTKTIIWRCEACKRPVFGDAGHLCATYQQINSGGLIHWTVLHDRCNPDNGAYSIDLVSLTHPSQVLGWTAHLAGKNWYARSDWRVLMATHGIDVSSEERTLEITPATREQLLELPPVVGPW